MDWLRGCRVYLYFILFLSGFCVPSKNVLYLRVNFGFPRTICQSNREVAVCCGNWFKLVQKSTFWVLLLIPVILDLSPARSH